MTGGKICSLMLLCALSATIATAAKFDVDIEEEGTEFTETIDVDIHSNTERFHVPAHNDVAGATFFYDFNKNYTMRKLDEGGCMLSDLSEVRKEVVPPRQLLYNLEASVRHGESRVNPKSETTVIKDNLHSYAIGGELDDAQRALLPLAMRELCEGEVIQWLYMLKGDIKGVTEEQGNTRRDLHEDDDEVKDLFGVLTSHHRARRMPTSCDLSNIHQRCKLRLKICSHKKVYTKYDTCKFSCQKKWAHDIDEILCCQYCCTDANQADANTPYCENLTPC